jgi:tRNA1(Val) A37 N6-methylase TrmN6
MAVDRDRAVTDDAVLGGRLRLKQPRHGHRVGHDAILLAAASGGEPGELVVDLGAGVGAAGLALAARVPGLSVTLVEVDADLAALATENARRNGLADRVRAVALDVGAPAHAFAAAGLGTASADRVLMNPPFYDPGLTRLSPDPRRRLAHAAGSSGAPSLDHWVRCAGRLLHAHGILTLIWRADGLAEVLAALAGRFGAIAVLPVHPRPDDPAIRVLVRAEKDSGAPLAVLPGLSLNDAAGRPSQPAEAILRHGASLPLAAAGRASWTNNERGGVVD